VINNRKVLGIIPARAGSKGLPGKNTKHFCGKPLIAYAIEAGSNCEFIDDLIVSTDSQEIAEIARKLGAQVPFIRPANLAFDITLTTDVVIHALDFFKDNMKQIFEYVIVIEPTSPLRDSTDLTKAMENLLKHETAKSIVGICLTENQNPKYLFKLQNNNNLVKYDKSNDTLPRRQDLDEVYFVEGSLYISDVDYFRQNKTFYHDKTMGYILPKWKSIEIDDIFDFIMAEALYLNKDKFEFPK
jgi:N-acylneuraminate cytidylyltransferase/CMP-N,N'-diacetyllegionaminic acid synthase